MSPQANLADTACIAAPGSPLSRSVINASIKTAIDVFERLHIHLPPFAYWTIDEWNRKGHEIDEVRDCMLGWDVTDFGSGNFKCIGRTLFTLRNGSVRHAGYLKTYAEKFILDPEGQRAPAHFHKSKREDIINRGGGNILIQLTKASDDNGWSSEPFTVQVDGETSTLAPRSIVRLKPGQSLTIPPRTIHQFWGEEGKGWTVSGEVSSVCDDLDDNFFLEKMSRFPEIIEDEPREFYLCHEYPCPKA